MSEPRQFFPLAGSRVCTRRQDVKADNCLAGGAACLQAGGSLIGLNRVFYRTPPEHKHARAKSSSIEYDIICIVVRILFCHFRELFYYPIQTIPCLFSQNDRVELKQFELKQSRFEYFFCYIYKSKYNLL